MNFTSGAREMRIEIRTDTKNKKETERVKRREKQKQKEEKIKTNEKATLLSAVSFIKNSEQQRAYRPFIRIIKRITFDSGKLCRFIGSVIKISEVVNQSVFFRISACVNATVR